MSPVQLDTTANCLDHPNAGGPIKPRQVAKGAMLRVPSDAQLSLHLVRGVGSTGQVIRDPFFDRSHRLITQLVPVQRQSRQGSALETVLPGQEFQHPHRTGGVAIRELIYQIVELFPGWRFHGPNLAHETRPGPMVPARSRTATANPVYRAADPGRWLQVMAPWAAGEGRESRTSTNLQLGQCKVEEPLTWAAVAELD